MAAQKAAVSRLRAASTSQRADKSSPASTKNCMERLPSEILLQILSYLDVSTLFSVSHVNKLFYRLANDNALWKKIYSEKLAKFKAEKPGSTDALLFTMTLAETQDGDVSQWKWHYFKTVAACDMNKWRRRLGHISRHTGLPSQTDVVLRKLNVSWELTVTDKLGREITLELSWPKFFETSVTLCWYGEGSLPDYRRISTLQLHGVRRIALNCPGLKTPGWRSLVAEVDVQTLGRSAQVIGEDRVVQLMLLQSGVVIGVWKDQCSVAFIMLALHLHRLVERSVDGSRVCPYAAPAVKPPFDDVDPEHGLHGYRLHFALHNTVCELVSGSFSQLFCRRTQISDGLIPLTAISRSDLSQHTPLSANVTLPWRSEALQGAVENCCFMSLTLLDEFRSPFKCVTSPVSVETEQTPVAYDYDGESRRIRYQDPDCQVKMELVWLREQKQFMLVSLVVFVSVCCVNEHFGTDY
ncbi:F-box only protein 15 [Mugil cephalus]|uniref:F-box only protein 15 n=1 Tax=Mugil cephalus TaxID=48193 RepID=UPI001FB702D5|nr:F-box only protein 15 [Mugil cephalus]